MPLAIACAYRLPGDVRLEEAPQRDGSSLWAVRHLGNCMNTSGEFEYEPMPSSRDDEFIARNRWPSAEAAYAAWEASRPTT